MKNLESIISQLSCPEATEHLDDLVHQLCSMSASGINNGGVDDQVDFIMREMGTKEGFKELQTIAAFVDGKSNG